MRKVEQGNKGITLIALMVTVIVLLILAGITVRALTGDDGIIKEARSSKESAEKAALEEQVEAAIIIVEQKYRNPTLTQVIDEIMKIETVVSVEETTGTVTSKSGYVIEGKLNDYIKTFTMEEAQQKGKFDKKTIIQDSVGKRLLIPANFKISSDSADKVTDGVVIEDLTGNQFVWVPVDDINNFKRIEGYFNGSLNSMSDSWTEPFPNGYDNEANEYNAMYNSVKNNKGFYIGRFEAGRDSSGNVVVKRYIGVYDNIPWGNAMNDIEGTTAVKLSRDFATNNGYQGVTSTLCYGVQWDATMQFMDSNYINGSCAEDSYVRNSEGRGHYNASSPATTGLKSEYAEKNIYDMAGNVVEWTMEACNTDSRVVRGGAYFFTNGSTMCPASFRINSSFADYDEGIGFRIALHL